MLKAAARAVESKQPKGLSQDKLVCELLNGSEKSQELQATIAQALTDREKLYGRQRYAMPASVRSQVIDNMLLKQLNTSTEPSSSKAAELDHPTAAAGPFQQQVVVLGAGLDTRAWRLALPSGTAWYEVDKPDVMRFKAGKLKQAGAAVSLQDTAAPFPLQAGSYAALHSDVTSSNWSLLLRQAGWSSEMPTVWILEGLLYYLGPESAMKLLKALRDLSTGNSCAILSHFTQHHLDLQHASAKSSASKEVVTKFKSVLPADAAAYLSKQGWTLQQTADVVQECSKQDVALFGDLALTDAQVAEQSEYKVLLASRAL